MWTASRENTGMGERWSVQYRDEVETGETWASSVHYRGEGGKSDYRWDSSVHYRDEDGIRTSGAC